MRHSLSLRRRSPPSSRTKAVLVALMLLAVGFALLRGHLGLRDSRRLRTEGVATVATVVGKRIERTPGRHGGTRAHYLDVEYRTETGQVLVRSDRVSEARYERARIGDTLEAHYLPSDPATHALGAVVQPDYFWLLMGLLLLLLTIVYHFFGSERRDRAP